MNYQFRTVKKLFNFPCELAELEPEESEVANSTDIKSRVIDKPSHFSVCFSAFSCTTPLQCYVHDFGLSIKNNETN